MPKVFQWVSRAGPWNVGEGQGHRAGFPLEGVPGPQQIQSRLSKLALKAQSSIAIFLIHR